MRHPDFEEQIEPYLLGRLSEEETGRFEDHYFICPRCFRMTAERAALLDAVKAAGPGLAAHAGHEGRRPAKAGSRLRWRPIGWAAAGAALVILTVTFAILPRRESDPRVYTRTGGEVVRGEALTLVSPQGARTAAPEAFAWQAVPGAAEYTIILEGIDPIWSATTRELSIPAPPDVRDRLRPGRAFTWKVKAFSAEGLLLASSAETVFSILK